MLGVDPSSAVQRPANPSAPIATPAPPPVVVGGDTTPRFTLTGARFDGARALTPAELDKAWADQRGKPVSIADLGAIAKRAEALYAAHGFPFVAVLVTAQRVEGGVVHFKVIEGRIADVAILSADPSVRRQATAAFSSLVDKQPLAMADLESAYQRAKTIPGMAISGALRRGDTEGAMDLVVQAKRETWRTYANVNDFYPDTVGPWGVLFGIDHFGGSQYGDTSSLQAYSSVDGGSQYMIRATHAQGLDASGTTLDLMVLGAHADPGRDVSTLLLATNVAEGQIGFTQPLIAHLDNQLSVASSLQIDDQQTQVFRTQALTNDRLRIFSLSLVGQHRAPDDAGLALALEMRAGLSIFDGSRLGDNGLSRQGADPEAVEGRLALEGQTPAFHTVRLFGHLDGQLASAALTAPEQYAFGNMTIGRGYQPGAAFGDDALAGRVEVRFGPYPVWDRFKLSPFGFYDAGGLWTLTPGAHSERTLTSVGGGIRIEAPHQVHLDLIYAVPQQRPLGPGTPTAAPRLLFNLTVGLNEVFGLFHTSRPSGAGS